MRTELDGVSWPDIFGWTELYALAPLFWEGERERLGVVGEK